MKEIKEILTAFDEASASAKRTVLATVVEVIGSSYRRPGARMLIDEDGRITGAISGGCLEGDALRKAMLCLHQRVGKLVTYDTTADDDLEFGIQLGCNGLVRILFEPLEIGSDRVIALLRAAVDSGEQSLLITLFSPHLENAPQPGTLMLYRQDMSQMGAVDDPALQAGLRQAARQAFQEKCSLFKAYASEHSVTAFIEFLQPAVTLVIAGAGNDAQPLAAIARHLGWKVVVVDGRATHATAARFPLADEVQLLPAAECARALRPGKRTAYVLMTHNYHYDIAMLGHLLDSECFYIGLLGPRAKRERMLDELRGQGNAATPACEARIFGPAGLDIGAETADEIALSIATEIMAVLSRRQGGTLRAKADFIHARGQDEGCE